MESILTAKTLTMEELDNNDYKFKLQDINARDIKVGDYICYNQDNTRKTYVGRVSRRTDTTIWFNKTTTEPFDNLIYCDIYAYYNINEAINLCNDEEYIELRDITQYTLLKKIKDNFTMTPFPYRMRIRIRQESRDLINY